MEQERIFIKKRKGFVKLAIQAGVGEPSMKAVITMSGQRECI